MALALSRESTFDQLSQAWERAAHGDPEAQQRWQVAEGGGWEWRGDRLTARGAEWSALAWRSCGPQAMAALGSFAIEATASGHAQLAGLSLGPYKDFLTPLEGGSHRLRLEVEQGSGCWRFLVDGELQLRGWWDAKIAGVADLLDGELCLKAHNAAEAHFSHVRVEPLPATACEISVILTCNRFLQRLRVTLRNWCAQHMPMGSYEVLVAAPPSDDGCHQHLGAVARSHPHVALREVPIDEAMAMNKGAMLNRAVASSRGRWVLFTDADCLFEPSALATLHAHLRSARPALHYGERYHLSEAQTDALLAGRVDGLHDFPQLFRHAHRSWVDRAPWGYLQVVPRQLLERVPYPQHINHFAHTDSLFIEQCEKHGLRPAQVPGLRCLHLVHPFAWYGTDTFL